MHYFSIVVVFSVRRGQDVGKGGVEFKGVSFMTVLAVLTVLVLNK